MRYTELSVGDLEHWIARSLFAAEEVAQLSPLDRGECARMANAFVAAVGKEALIRPTRTRSPGVKSYCAYVAPVRWRHRPLAFCALNHAVGDGCHLG